MRLAPEAPDRLRTPLERRLVTSASSQPAIAMVDTEGVVTGARCVVAAITATAERRRATVPVEVRAASSMSPPG